MKNINISAFNGMRPGQFVTVRLPAVGISFIGILQTQAQHSWDCANNKSRTVKVMDITRTMKN